MSKADKYYIVPFYKQQKKLLFFPQTGRCFVFFKLP